MLWLIWWFHFCRSRKENEDVPSECNPLFNVWILSCDIVFLIRDNDELYILEKGHVQPRTWVTGYCCNLLFLLCVSSVRWIWVIIVICWRCYQWCGAILSSVFFCRSDQPIKISKSVASIVSIKILYSVQSCVYPIVIVLIFCFSSQEEEGNRVPPKWQKKEKMASGQTVHWLREVALVSKTSYV